MNVVRFAIQQLTRFGDDFELDPGAYELRRAGQSLKLERIPLKILFLLAEHPGQLVARDQIVERIWGSDIHLDTDNSINGAIRKIRQALGDSCEDPRFIQTVTGEGYRFMAPMRLPGDEVPLSAATAPSVTATEPAAFNPTTNKLRSFKLLSALAATVVLATIGIVLVPRRNPAASPVSQRTMLAVLPFQNLTGDPSQEYFSQGMTEELIARLGGLDPQHLGVIARTSIMHYEGSSAPLNQVGRELGVQYVLEGSVRRDSARVRITAELIQIRDQTHLWVREYDRDPSTVLTVQDEIARSVSVEIQRSLHTQLKTEFPVRRADTAASYEAFDLYLKGRFFWNKRTTEGFRQAADYFQQAISKDPDYARAYAGLADTYGLMSTWHQADQNEVIPKARAAALKALEIDATLAEAHTSLALIAESYDYDWKTAEQEFRRAIQLNPDYATAHHWYAEYLSWQGRFEEALAESERARQIDPFSLIIASDHGAILYYSRQYDRAVEHCKTVLEMDPNNQRARGLLFASYVQQGKFEDALKTLQRLHYPPDSPWMAASRALLYGRWGQSAEAGKSLRQLEKLSRSGRPDTLPGLIMAYSSVGSNDRCLQLLEAARLRRSNAVVTLKVEPGFDSLRSDPRFQSLLHRMALD